MPICPASGADRGERWPDRQMTKAEHRFPFGRARALLLAACVAGMVAGCSSLPAWTGLQVPDEPEASGPVAYPDLHAIPAPPPPPAAAAVRDDTVQSLTADRARVAQARDALRRSIENDFAYPAPPTPSGP
jgi:hypothetical protein